jgi:hypothetical protein
MIKRFVPKLFRKKFSKKQMGRSLLFQGLINLFCGKWYPARTNAIRHRMAGLFETAEVKQAEFLNRGYGLVDLILANQGIMFSIAGLPFGIIQIHFPENGKSLLWFNNVSGLHKIIP